MTSCHARMRLNEHNVLALAGSKCPHGRLLVAPGNPDFSSRELGFPCSVTVSPVPTVYDEDLQRLVYNKRMVWSDLLLRELRHSVPVPQSSAPQPAHVPQVRGPARVPQVRGWHTYFRCEGHTRTEGAWARPSRPFDQGVGPKERKGRQCDSFAWTVATG
jgi:hypothetical protein